MEWLSGNSHILAYLSFPEAYLPEQQTGNVASIFWRTSEKYLWSEDKNTGLPFHSFISTLGILVPGATISIVPVFNWVFQIEPHVSLAESRYMSFLVLSLLHMYTCVHKSTDTYKHTHTTSKQTPVIPISVLVSNNSVLLSWASAMDWTVVKAWLLSVIAFGDNLVRMQLKVLKF